LFGLGGLAFLGAAAGTGDAGFIFGALGYGVGGLIGTGIFVALAVPSLAGGYGIIRRKNWGRIAAFVAAVLMLGSVPIGTLVGVFTFVVLLDDEAKAEFD
jgi:hypothetical protein